MKIMVGVDRGAIQAVSASTSFTESSCAYDSNNAGSSAIVTHTANASIVSGLGVSGVGIPEGAYIASIDSGTQFTLSANTTGGTLTGQTLTFVTIPYDGTITLSNDLEVVAARQLLLITNIKEGQIYYNFADADLNIAVDGNTPTVITIQGVEIGASVDADDIQVIMEDGKAQSTGAGLVTERHNLVKVTYPDTETQLMKYYFGVEHLDNLVAEVTVTLDVNGNVISLQRTD